MVAKGFAWGYDCAGVKYQRHVHKEKLAAEAHRNIELAAPGSLEDSVLRSSDGGRSQRSCTSGSRGGSLGRHAIRHGESTSEDTDPGSATPPRVQSKRTGRIRVISSRAHRLSPSVSSLNEAFAAPSVSGRPRSKSGPRKARPTSSAGVGTAQRAAAALAANGAAAAAHAVADAPSGKPLPVRRLDGLQMQRQQNGVVLALSNVTVLLQPVSQAQRLWGAAPDSGPAVAICAYDSGGSFLAAAPRTAGGSDRGSWAFPSTTSAAWISGHDWTLFFSQQREYDEFNSASVHPNSF